MEKTLEEKKEHAAKVIAALKKEYPDADCTLDYNEAWKLLVSVRLAAQCTDARVNVVVQDLYKKFPDVKALAEAARPGPSYIPHVPASLSSRRTGHPLPI